jgi:nicotinamidase/pyrazinamidase
MELILRHNGIERFVLYGIATDYCVRASRIDALRAGFEMAVIQELCRGVAPETSQAAWKEMKEKGVNILQRFDINRIKGL